MRVLLFGTYLLSCGSPDQPPLGGSVISEESLGPVSVVEASAVPDDSTGQVKVKRAPTPMPDTYRYHTDCTSVSYNT